MQASEIMNRHVISVRKDAPIGEAIRLMLDHHVSGLPVLDEAGELAGIITEGDLLRRSETATEKHHSWWSSWLRGNGAQAGDYVRAHTRHVCDLMTDRVLSVGPSTPLDEIVDLMESRRVKRVPVVMASDLVGIVSRSDLLRALSAAMDTPQGVVPGESDDAITRRIADELDKQPWFARGQVRVEVHGGVVDLVGVYTDSRERDAVRVAAENVAGVTAVRDKLQFVDPNTGAMYG